MEKVMDEKHSGADCESEPSTTTTKTGPSVSNKSEKNKQEKAVESIVNMGYPEEDVRRALRAAFYNQERAVQYLVDGIPESPSTPEGDNSYSTDSTDVSPFEFMRTNPLFLRMRRSMRLNPQNLYISINRMGKRNPQILRYINENHQEFVNMLFELSDDEGEEGEDKAGEQEEEEEEETGEENEDDNDEESKSKSSDEEQAKECRNR